jgi:hypothetical protein
VRRWFKRLPKADAQHPAQATTNVTGALRLTQARHPIDQRTYFRNTFFADLPWAADMRPRRAGGEAVTLQVEVHLPGSAPRTANLLIAHDLSRVSGQGNFSTSIHWGVLQADMFATDYTGKVVTLERLADGTCRLTIADGATGAFIS